MIITDQVRQYLLEAIRLIGFASVQSSQALPTSATLRKVRSGQTRVSPGDPFSHVCVVRLGTFKTLLHDEVEYEQILDFSIRSDLLGVESCAAGLYDCYSVAVEDSEVLSLSLDQFWPNPDLGKLVERHVLQRACMQINYRHRLRASMATLGADARVARFLVSLADRYAALGYSPNLFVLRMTRQEIASHLGLTMETVSRAFNHLARADLIAFDQRKIRLLDLACLRQTRGIASTVGTRSARRKSYELSGLSPGVVIQ